MGVTEGSLDRGGWKLDAGVRPTPKWRWYGDEPALLDLVATELRTQGYKLEREIRLVEHAGRLDLVACSDTETLFIEIKSIRRYRVGHTADYYRDAMTGLGQLLIYRELVESRPGKWFLIEELLATYGGPLWRGEASPPGRWILLLAIPDPVGYRLVEAAARRAGIEFWLWLPPGELWKGQA